MIFAAVSGWSPVASKGKAVISRAVILLTCLLASSRLYAVSPDALKNSKTDRFTIAVAANFVDCLNNQLLPEWPGPTPRILRGATGRLAAQIQLGAPVDVFLAADVNAPLQLERLGLATANSRFSYALGELVLVGRNDDDSEGQGWFSTPVTLPWAQKHLAHKTVALANPRTAPYGRAATELLAALNEPSIRRIQAENVAQAWQFFFTGNVDYALVAKSLVVAASRNGSTLKNVSTWPVPATLYSAIEQQAVSLNESPVSRRFLTFLKTADTSVQRCGYKPGVHSPSKQVKNNAVRK